MIWADWLAPRLRARPAIYGAWRRLKSGLPLSWLHGREPSARRLAAHARKHVGALKVLDIGYPPELLKGVKG